MDSQRLRATATEVLTRSRSLDLASINEANTKALFIEPLLGALGWDTLNMDSVTREYQVYDGTFLDYALLVSRRPALFVEAKPTKKKLDDPKWVSQAINYANNEGVMWCVLTDGLLWRVFKANEAAPMEQKLAFEVRLSDLFDDTRSIDADRLFSCLTPIAVADGELSRLGTQVFVDTKVREALIEILDEPHKKVVDLIKAQLADTAPLKPADLRGALARIVRPAVDALVASRPPTSRMSSAVAGVFVGVPEDSPAIGVGGDAVSGEKVYFGVTLHDLLGAGLIVSGDPLASTSHKWPATATITADGRIEYDGGLYDSPSPAGSAVKNGMATDGWRFWSVERGGALVSLHQVRQEFVDSRPAPAE